MFKVLLLSSFLVHNSFAFLFLDHIFGTSEPKWINATEMIRQHQYPCQEHVVTTEDGYLLDLVRIRSNLTMQEEKQQNKMKKLIKLERDFLKTLSSMQSTTEEAKSDEVMFEDEEMDSIFAFRKPAVLLMPAMMTNAESFLVGGPLQGLAYMLADQGFDVFMGNTRGSNYGLKHSVLKSEQDPMFWKFGLHEIATRDVTAIIDKVLEISKEKTLKYVGHMEGSTLFFIMTSEKPKFNNKISSMVAMGPVAMMKHSHNLILKKVSENLPHKGWLIRNVGMTKFNPSPELIQDSVVNCTQYGNPMLMCENMFFLMNGYNGNNMNMTTMEALMQVRPDSSSTRKIINYAQFMAKGRFGKCNNQDDNCRVMRDYDISSITVPVSMIYTSKDSMSTIDDIQKLREKLTTVSNDIVISNYNNNMELLYGNNVSTVVVPMVVRTLLNQEIKSIESM